MISSKKNILFFVVLGFVLFFPENSWADAIDIYHKTACGEEIKIGSYRLRECCIDEDTCRDCNRYSCGGSWWEYRANTKGCEPTIQRRRCRSYCSSYYGESCCEWCRACSVECGIWEEGKLVVGAEECEECHSWQRAVRDSCEDPESGKWCREKPECTCCGCPGDSDCDPEESCVEAPTGLEIYQSPFSDIREDPLNNIRLPIRLAWNDVPGWWGGWSGGGPNMDEYWHCRQGCVDYCRNKVKEDNPGYACWGLLVPDYIKCLRESTADPCDCEHLIPGEEECDATCPMLNEEYEECYDPKEFVQSYKIEIEGELMNCDALASIESYTAVLETSEFIPPCSCFFKSNRKYEWRVRACCTADGKNCGPWSEKMEFQTSLAPEPVWPYDPDWIGEDGIENLDLVESRELKWCKIEDPTHYYHTVDRFTPLSYKILINYFNENEGRYTCHPLLLTKEGECRPAYLGPDGYFPPDTFATEGLVTRNSSYAWQIAACRDTLAFDCSPYSQEWRFSTITWDVGIARSSPQNDPETPIGLPVRIAWATTLANSFNYKIYEGEVDCNTSGPIEEGQTLKYEKTLHHQNKAEPFAILDLDTVYTWCVQPCQDFKAEDCEDYWGGPWHFRTTGRPPEKDTMKPSDEDGEEALIPVEFSWEKVPGAGSYWFQFEGEEPILIPRTEAKIELDYPGSDLKPETSYSWKVQTCAQTDGEICGDYEEQTFTTFSWQEPTDPNPKDGSETPQAAASWERVPGARSYKYTVTFIEVDKDEPRQQECEDEEGKLIDQGIIRRPPVKFFLGLKCWGEYEWSVIPCLDENCQIQGPEKSWSFVFKAPFLPTDTKPGLMPCNQPFYDHDRPWLDETEPCGIKHLFILLFMLIDFLLIRIVPMVLVLLALASGVIFYFSLKMEAPNPIAKVKSLWKAAGIGIGLLLFAWIITSSLLNLFGYQLGPWHILGG